MIFLLNRFTEIIEDGLQYSVGIMGTSYGSSSSLAENSSGVYDCTGGAGAVNSYIAVNRVTGCPDGGTTIMNGFASNEYYFACAPPERTSTEESLFSVTAGSGKNRSTGFLASESYADGSITLINTKTTTADTTGSCCSDYKSARSTYTTDAKYTVGVYSRSRTELTYGDGCNPYPVASSKIYNKCCFPRVGIIVDLTKNTSTYVTHFFYQTLQYDRTKPAKFDYIMTGGDVHPGTIAGLTGTKYSHESVKITQLDGFLDSFIPGVRSSSFSSTASNTAMYKRPQRKSSTTFQAIASATLSNAYYTTQTSYAPLDVGSYTTIAEMGFMTPIPAIKSYKTSGEDFFIGSGATVRNSFYEDNFFSVYKYVGNSSGYTDNGVNGEANADTFESSGASESRDKPTAYMGIGRSWFNLGNGITWERTTQGHLFGCLYGNVFITGIPSPMIFCTEIGTGQSAIKSVMQANLGVEVGQLTDQCQIATGNVSYTVFNTTFTQSSAKGTYFSHNYAATWNGSSTSYVASGLLSNNTSFTFSSSESGSYLYPIVDSTNEPVIVPPKASVTIGPGYVSSYFDSAGKTLTASSKFISPVASFLADGGAFAGKDFCVGFAASGYVESPVGEGQAFSDCGWLGDTGNISDEKRDYQSLALRPGMKKMECL